VGNEQLPPGTVPVVANIGDNQVSVNVSDLVSYGGGMGALGIETTALTSPRFMNMAPTRQHAFAPIADLSAGQLQNAWGLMAQQEHAVGAFQQFLADACLGLTCIGSAATVIAHSYAGADARSSATIEAVRYAFHEKGYDKPAGLTLNETIDGRTVQEQRLDPAGVVDALSPSAEPVETYRFEGGTMLVFADGSIRTESHDGTFGQAPGWGTTVSTSATIAVYGPGGIPLGTPAVTTNTYALSDGRPVGVRTEQDAFTRTTVLNPNGSTTTTTVRPERPGEEPDDDDETVTDTDTTRATAPSGSESAADDHAQPLDDYIERWSDPEDIQQWRLGMSPA
jgi:hypothetical protein